MEAAYGEYAKSVDRYNKSEDGLSSVGDETHTVPQCVDDTTSLNLLCDTYAFLYIYPQRFFTHDVEASTSKLNGELRM
jgi:hypothetical protein